MLLVRPTRHHAADTSGTSSEPARQEQVKQVPSRRDNRAVAVVDDDPAVCDSIQILLDVHGFVAHTYLSGATFLQEQRQISCLIVDYQMPGLNGLELVAEWRTRSSAVPVIMMTATTDARIGARAAQLGITRVLTKPLGSALISALQEELGEG
jgi:two-component system, LuxR family, response regulator FixJ